MALAPGGRHDRFSLLQVREGRVSNEYVTLSADMRDVTKNILYIIYYYIFTSYFMIYDMV